MYHRSVNTWPTNHHKLSCCWKAWNNIFTEKIRYWSCCLHSAILLTKFQIRKRIQFVLVYRWNRKCPIFIYIYIGILYLFLDSLLLYWLCIIREPIVCKERSSYRNKPGLINTWSAFRIRIINRGLCGWWFSSGILR